MRIEHCTRIKQLCQKQIFVQHLLTARHFDMSQNKKIEYKPKEARYNFPNFDCRFYLYDDSGDGIDERFNKPYSVYIKISNLLFT